MRKLFTISIVVVSVLAVVTFVYLSRLLVAPNTVTTTTQRTEFVSSFQKLVGEANNLTESYQSEVTKWKTHHLDNKTMISVTDSYFPKFERLINQSKTIQSPREFQTAASLYTKSLGSELLSYKHFKNYLLTNNSTENQLASRSLSDAFVQEVAAFKVLQPSGLFKFVP